MDSKTIEAVCYWARFYEEWREMLGELAVQDES
jgi:hypothetical protein